MNLSIAERLAALEQFGPLDEGSHDDRRGVCVMEAVAFVAGEPWSDNPECACPVISVFLRSWNDALPDEERDALLRPLIPRLIGTRSNLDVERRRALMAINWLVREHTPAWLRVAKLDAAANALARLPEITDMAQIPSIRGPIEAAQRDAAAAGAAVGDAAWAAARNAARDAAWAAARNAAWAAARNAARDVLSTTRRELQQSALRLVERMIACEGRTA